MSAHVLSDLINPLEKSVSLVYIYIYIYIYI